MTDLEGVSTTRPRTRPLGIISGGQAPGDGDAASGRTTSAVGAQAANRYVLAHLPLFPTKKETVLFASSECLSHGFSDQIWIKEVGEEMDTRRKNLLSFHAIAKKK